jgi:3-vinyl bacteriochlorophyllide hydratase
MTPEQRERKRKSVWTIAHLPFALGQLMAFFVSVVFLIGFFRGTATFEALHTSVLVKIGLMAGALITGSLWEHDVYGKWWFAPEFFLEDLMTFNVVLLQGAYLYYMYVVHAPIGTLTGLLVAGYTVYLINVVQYIVRSGKNGRSSSQHTAIGEVTPV